MPKPLKYKPVNHKDFTKVLGKKVRTYFKENNLSSRANAAMVRKTIFCVTFWIGSYLLLMLGGFSATINYFIWMTLGISVALVSVNVGHDAIHGAYTKKKWLKTLLSMTFNLNGASAYMWDKMHNVAHHTYTNIYGYDEDISPVPIIRLSPAAELKSVHKNQHLYSWFFYFIGTLSWVLMKDYKKFFENTVGNFHDSKHPKQEYFLLFFYKLINYSLFIVAPYFILDVAWYHILLGYLLMHACSGFYLAIVFMLAHAVEEVHFPIPKSDGIIEADFAAHQMFTTANFASKSWLAGFLTGGLNQQIEHHLFPNYCSIHYRTIAPIVKQTAAEYGLPYFDAPTFGSAIRSHFRFLKRIGRQENYQPSELATRPEAA